MGITLVRYPIFGYGPVDQTALSHVFTKLSKQQVTYSTRAMQHEFLQRYNRLINTPKSVLCTFITHFSTNALLVQNARHPESMVKMKSTCNFYVLTHYYNMCSDVAHGPVLTRKLIAVDHGNGIRYFPPKLNSRLSNVTSLPANYHIVKTALYIDSLCTPIKGRIWT